MRASRTLLLVACLLLAVFTCSAPSSSSKLATIRSGKANLSQRNPAGEESSASPLRSAYSVDRLPSRSSTALLADATLSSLAGTAQSVTASERSTLLHLSSILFLSTFMFTVVRDVKDTLIVTNCGAESIPFVKAFGVLPASAILALVYSRLVDLLPPVGLFYAVLAPFLAFVSSFSILFYPASRLSSVVHWTAPTASLGNVVSLARHWPSILCFIAFEAWGAVGVPLLFWSCTKDIVSAGQVRRMYSTLCLVSNLAPWVAGAATSWLSSRALYSRSLPSDEAFAQVLRALLGLATVAGSLAAIFYARLRSLHPPSAASLSPSRLVRTKPHSLPPLWTSLRQLAGESRLHKLAVIAAASCALMLDCSEAVWRAATRLALPDPLEHLAFLGRYSALVGVGASLWTARGLGRPAVNGRNKSLSASFGPPLILAVLAFPLLVLEGQKVGLPRRSTFLAMAYVGLTQQVVSRAVKYVVLDRQGGAGKALGERLGRTGSVLALQAAVLAGGSVVRTLPALSALFYAVFCIWSGSAWLAVRSR